MSRAISPVVGTLLLVMITVTAAGILAATVGSAALGGPVDSTGGNSMTDFTRISAEATADGDVILTHEGGESIDVDEISVRVTVDGTPLEEQPPVPFFSTAGFEAGPTGPFNSAAEQTWTAGGTASFTISESNSPMPDPGDEVVLTLQKDGRQIAQTSTSVLGDDAD